jgi:hypothetical protein
LRHMKYLSADILPNVFYGLMLVLYIYYSCNSNLQPK